MIKKLLILSVCTSLFLSSCASFQPKLDTANQATIILAEPLFSLSPYSLTESNNQRVRLVYEPILRTNTELQIEPALVSSYGALSPTKYEFTLNQNIYFHNKTLLTTKNIVDNFQYFKSYDNLKPFINNIEKIEIIDEHTFVIHLIQPDTLFYNKLTYLPIINSDDFKAMIGTGPYKISKYSQQELLLEQNEQYYGRKPPFKTVKFIHEADPIKRIKLGSQDPTTILVYPISENLLHEDFKSKFQVNKFQTSAVNFFLFNLNKPKLQDSEIRRILSSVFTSNFILEATDNTAVPTTQFVSSGVFGHTPNEVVKVKSNDEVFQELYEHNLIGLELSIALPQNSVNFKYHLEKYFSSIGIIATIDLIDEEKLLESEIVENYDLLFSGWKSTSGDSTEFILNFVKPDLLSEHKQTLQDLISKIIEESDLEQKQEILNTIFQIITYSNPIGIPLFENQAVYALARKFNYTPRLDGFIDIYNFVAQ